MLILLQYLNIRVLENLINLLIKIFKTFNWGDVFTKIVFFGPHLQINSSMNKKEYEDDDPEEKAKRWNTYAQSGDE